MAQPMSIKEMIRVIDDVFGGSFVITKYQRHFHDEPGSSNGYMFEVKSLDEGGAEVGQFDIPCDGPARTLASGMRINAEYDLAMVPFGVVQYIGFKDEDFRDYIMREMQP